MARRPDPWEFSDRPLTKAELELKREKLALLSEYSVERRYKEAHEACRMDGNRLPKPSAIQELVTCWKQLWGWRTKRCLRGMVIESP